jgi:hypothetical protein
MKSKDIQKAVKFNLWDIMNGHTEYPIFFITYFAVLEKQNIPKDAASKALQFNG